ncbi:hypothetical protein M8C21_007487 [Ambrosia artemisiifolia]|uniref:TNase-like domain-containing protein n=1 Tax=Ambrosia artemisiifolia TaxID=4212 RepID=A0AAD5CZR3_AMBAR|nr:hypothetical protein M8C21_007487 [Ambrosia artemisiifolia]
MSKRLCVEMTAKGEPAGDGVSDSTDCGAALPENNPESVADPLAALEDDITKFETESKVPLDLAWHVSSEETTHRLWFKKLSDAWSTSKPKDPKEATKLVYDTLNAVHSKHGAEYADIKGFLHFYGLPPCYSVVKPPCCDQRLSVEVDFLASPVVEDVLPFRIYTYPVFARDIMDGVNFTVFVVVDDPCLLPQKILFAATERCKALDNNDPGRADKMLDIINTSQNYGLLFDDNTEYLTRKYPIRLRGIRAPEIETDDGIKARDELAKMIKGKSLMISVHHIDEKKRCVGDVYSCNGTLLQEMLLKKGDAVSWGWKKEPLQ